jgi:hypothetical protein
MEFYIFETDQEQIYSVRQWAMIILLAYRKADTSCCCPFQKVNYVQSYFPLLIPFGEKNMKMA